MQKQIILTTLKRRLSLTKKSKVLVVGLGETGFSVTKFLQSLAIKVAVVDNNIKPPLLDLLLQKYPYTPVFTGSFTKVSFRAATHIVVSPGISLSEPKIHKSILAGVKLVSDIDLLSCASDTPIVAITGSNGKSTVTTMLNAMAKNSNVATAIGGNLGAPALDLLGRKLDLYLLELSSFQLERTRLLNAKAATVLNISEDHLDRHNDIKTYADTKQSIFSGNGVMVLNADDPIVKAMTQKGRKISNFTIRGNYAFHVAKRQNQEWLMHDNNALMRVDELSFQGGHNIANALAALALGLVAGFKMSAMCEALHKFEGLDHRIQKVAIVNGVTWINDSKATNVGACIAALQGYKNKIVLIAGGDTKGAKMKNLIPAVKAKVKCVVLMGKDARKIENELNSCVPSYKVKNLKEAVRLAAKFAKDGENVLLSPACASLDQYKNYQERGARFVHEVMELAM